MKQSQSSLPIHAHTFTNPYHTDDIDTLSHELLHRKNVMHKSNIVLNISDETIEGIKDRYEHCDPYGTLTTDILVDLFTSLLSNRLFKNNFNVFKHVFEEELKTEIEKVLRFYSMKTSKKIIENFQKK